MKHRGKGKLIAEGKTKRVYAHLGIPYEVLIESKDDITAGDGVRHDVMPGKGEFATETTCNCFRLLAQNRIPNHFIQMVTPNMFRASRLRMIPMELVARRIATGSFLKRKPDVQEGTRFPKILIEFFLKDDANHDPLMLWNKTCSCFSFHDPKKPMGKSRLKEFSPSVNGLPTKIEQVMQLMDLTGDTFFALEKAWAKQEVTLVDLKIECGVDAETGKVLVGDVIDNDSWRIWPKGDKSRMLDKQLYRDLAEPTADVLAIISANYAAVQLATRKFVPIA